MAYSLAHISDDIYSDAAFYANATLPKGLQRRVHKLVRMAKEDPKNPELRALMYILPSESGNLFAIKLTDDLRIIVTISNGGFQVLDILSMQVARRYFSQA